LLSAEAEKGAAVETKRREPARNCVTIRLPDSDAQRLRELAEADDRKTASLARIWIQRTLREKTGASSA
jgi:hypothetical protein